METLSQLVSESLARYGVVTSLDHRRLLWSKWFRCGSSSNVQLVPSKPGLFALGEEVAAPIGGKRILALFQVSETEDLGLALGCLFLPGSPQREQLAEGHCFTRYAVIEDAAQRQAAYQAFQQWMASSAEIATGAGNKPAMSCALGNSQAEVQMEKPQVKRSSPAP